MRILLMACSLLFVCPTIVRSQNNEVSLMGGGGGFFSGGGSIPAPAFTLGYTRHIAHRIAVEGALEGFYLRGDDFAGGQVAALYYFRSVKEDSRLVPYLTVGVGKTSTDFTEIKSQLVVRLGGGFKYYFLTNLGLRVEIRDEIIRTGGGSFYPLPGSRSQLVTGRVGIGFRF